MTVAATWHGPCVLTMQFLFMTKFANIQGEIAGESQGKASLDGLSLHLQSFGGKYLPDNVGLNFPCKLIM